MEQKTSPRDIVHDPELFAKHFLRILNKQAKLVPFTWNKAQRHFHQHRTGHDLILKARQLGFSTYIQGEMFRRTVTETRSTMTLAHDSDTTTKLRIMADRFYSYCQFNEAKPFRHYANASLTTYPEFNSVASISTAGSLNTGRGGTYNEFHGSEVAFWPDAESIVTGAMQGGNPDVVLESTPNGAQGYFYELCMEALSGNSIWTLHFYPWWWDDEYRIPVEGKIEYTEEEYKLVQQHNLTPEQINWRRKKKKELRDFFIQEYPEDPYTCFLASGNSYFGNTGDVFTAPMNPKIDIAHDYCAGLDFGQTNDYTALAVFDKNAKAQVDLLHIRKLEWKEQRKRIVETIRKWTFTRCGCGNIMIGYHKVCDRCGHEDVISHKYPFSVGEVNSIGSVNLEWLQSVIPIMPFQTTNESKADVMSDAYEAFHTLGWKLQDHKVQRHEFNTFVSTQTATNAWRLAAEGSGHDDTVIACALGIYAGSLSRTLPSQVKDTSKWIPQASMQGWTSTYGVKR